MMQNLTRSASSIEDTEGSRERTPTSAEKRREDENANIRMKLYEKLPFATKGLLSTRRHSNLLPTDERQTQSVI